MNFAKKAFPFLIVAIAFGIAGYFIGTSASSRDQAASVFNAGPAAASAMCQKYPNDPRCKGGLSASPDDSIQMASAMCQKYPNDPRCKGGFVKPAEKAAMTLGACIRAKGVPQIDAQDNYSGCAVAK